MLKKLIFFFILMINAAGVFAQNITENYIETHLQKAQEIMRMHKIPASIVLGIAIHESAAGTSRVARLFNNHFGIKGKNNSPLGKSAYKNYEESEDSYEHFTEFMTNRKAFANLFSRYDQYDYVAWARGIQRGGYARSKTWASQVINIIKKHNLYLYDERPEDYVEPVHAKPKNSVKKSSFYTVKSGDNLGRIAKKMRTTVKKIMLKNGLKSSNLKPGQKLKL